jgi:hypothetical protein
MAHRKPETRHSPDLGPCPGLRLSPGLTTCPDCGGTVGWDPQAPGQRVSAALGLSHHCPTARQQLAQMGRWLAGEDIP